VQGVGFRPYVHRLAGELGLAGYVLNDSQGVLLEIEGSSDAVALFLARLGPDAPPLAVLESLTVVDAEPIGADGFEIRPSPHGERADVPVTPDGATCDDCLRELLDPSDRRYRYPFINCTNCGPRFTIVRGVPYDRPLTTMAGFQMCEQCRAEYDNPRDRRFHAQPNACPRCGPSLSLLDSEGRAVARWDAALAAAVEALRGGAVVAIKGIGGYHLACRADDDAAVGALRARKHREDKPFALMVGTLVEAARVVEIGDAERGLMSSPQRPIVLAPRLAGAPVAESVAPGALELGVMLPYSPLHHLLIRDFRAGALVMTSGNVSDEPIAFRDADAVQRLGAIADLLLLHNRPIETRTDDSVARVVASRRPLFVRRSRGYVPLALTLPGGTLRPLLGCGAELKNTFCLARGSRAWVSHHIGDLENYETLESFTEGIEHFERLFSVAPAVVAHDLHPEYLSTKYAFERDGVELVGVQHHHAHLAACLAEHGERGTAVGAIFDGSGYGTDGTIWGGELLVGDTGDFRRAGHVAAVRLPGGDSAIREPWRVACAWLTAAGATPPRALRELVPERKWAQVAGLVQSGVASPLTTSMGRLFDAVSALCGLRTAVNYEGQAAIELEAACDPHERGCYPIGLESVDGALVIDPRELVGVVCADLAAGVAPGVVASRFHAAVAAVTVDACGALAGANGTDIVVLSGGVFLNRRLLERVCAGLDERGLRVLTPERLPIGDGGISYGQAAVAARRMTDA
jgi:hydrogenase maturation protein HypF